MPSSPLGKFQLRTCPPMAHRRLQPLRSEGKTSWHHCPSTASDHGQPAPGGKWHSQKPQPGPSLHDEQCQTRRRSSRSILYRGAKVQVAGWVQGVARVYQISQEFHRYLACFHGAATVRMLLPVNLAIYPPHLSSYLPPPLGPSSCHQTLRGYYRL